MDIGASRLMDCELDRMFTQVNTLIRFFIYIISFSVYLFASLLVRPH